MNRDRIDSLVESIFPQVLSHRLHLHAHPELSFQEYETMNYVSNALTELGIRHDKEVGGTGVVGYITSPNSSEWIGLRADLDALPISEQNDVPYRSKVPGVMHACGHDVHTSILLGTAAVLMQMRDELPVSVKLIFQPGEEVSPGGANYIIDAGIMDNPTLNAMVALHVYPEMEVGNVGIKPGLMMASSDEIRIEIEGKGGHGALPDKCINPIAMAAEIISQTPSLLIQHQPKEVPTVLSYGYIEGLGAVNVIPSTCTLKGTFRTMNEEWRKSFFEHYESFLKEIEVRYGGVVKLHRVKGYPFLENDPLLTAKVEKNLKEHLGEDQVHPIPIRMTAEDFAFYAAYVPICFFRLGVGDPNKTVNHSVHHPKFDIHSDGLKVGVSSMVSIVMGY